MGEEEKTKDAIRFFRMIPTLALWKKQRPHEYASLQLPGSLLAEAWVRLGEFYFSNNQRQQAKIAYSKVIAFPSSKVFDKAL